MRFENNFRYLVWKPGFKKNRRSFADRVTCGGVQDGINFFLAEISREKDFSVFSTKQL